MFSFLLSIGSLFAWGLIILVYFAVVEAQQEEKVKEKRENISFGDVITFPGVAAKAMAPLLVLGGVIYLLARPFM